MSSRPSTGFGSKPTPRAGGGGGGHGSRDGGQHVTLNDQGVATLQEKSKGGFICKMRFSNEIPDLPFDPKFLAYPFESSRLTRYQPTSLERSFKYQLVTEPDLGIRIDLIEPEIYDPPEEGAELQPEDEAMLKAEVKETAKGRAFNPVGAIKRSSVPWLHKTAYFGNDDLYGMNQGGRAKPEMPIPIQEELKQLTPAELTNKIEDTFVAASSDINSLKHPRDPNLKPMACWQVFPDFDRWAMDYTELVFDHDPCSEDAEVKGADASKRARLAGNALMHVHRQGAQHKNFAYMVPAVGSGKRKRALADGEDGEGGAEEEEGGETEYQVIREYRENEARMHQEEWNNDHFVFIVPSEGGNAYYHPIKRRTYIRKDKEVINSGQLSSMSARELRKLVNHPENPKRYPLHDAAKVSYRGFNEEEEADIEGRLEEIGGKAGGGGASKKQGAEKDGSGDVTPQDSPRAGGGGGGGGDKEADSSDDE